MSPRIARYVEIGSVVAIGVAFLFGGRILLVNLSHIPRYAIPVLIVLGLLQAWRVLAQLAGRTAGPADRRHARRRVHRRAVLLAIAFVASPARWSIGAAVVALELGIVLEVLGQLPAARMKPHSQRRIYEGRVLNLRVDDIDTPNGRQARLRGDRARRGRRRDRAAGAGPRSSSCASTATRSTPISGRFPRG